MTTANVTAEHTANTVIENTVNNQRKQNKHLGIKEDLHSFELKLNCFKRSCKLAAKGTFVAKLTLIFGVLKLWNSRLIRHSVFLDNMFTV